MDDESKFIDKQAVKEQGITPNSPDDPGAMPAPHSLPLSPEFEEVAEEQEENGDIAGTTRGSIQEDGEE